MANEVNESILAEYLKKVETTSIPMLKIDSSDKKLIKVTTPDGQEYGILTTELRDLLQVLLG